MTGGYIGKKGRRIVDYFRFLKTKYGFMYNCYIRKNELLIEITLRKEKFMILDLRNELDNVYTDIKKAKNTAVPLYLALTVIFKENGETYLEIAL